MLLAVETAAVPTLSRLASLPFLAVPGASPAAWRLWLQQTAPADAVAAVLRLVATGFAWWLLASTLTYLAARLLRVPCLLRASSWTTLPAVRRLVDGALALSLAATLTGGGVAMAAAGPTPVPTPGVAPRSPGAAPAVPVPQPQPQPPPFPFPLPIPFPSPAAQPPVSPLTPGVASPAPAPSVHVVVTGDNLWEIAAGRIAGDRGGRPPTAQVAAYWETVVSRNRPGLRSGNPDLIFPGEDIALPPVPPGTP